MKVLFVYQFLTLGGVEVVLRGRLDELNRRGIDARVLFLESCGGESIFEDVGDWVYVGNSESLFREVLDSLQPSVISVIDTPSVIGSLRRLAPAAAIVCEVHTPYAENQKYLLDSALLADVTGFIVPTKSQSELVRERIAITRPVRVVSNFLPQSFIAESEPASVPSRPTVLWVGRLDPLKNWRAFIDVAGRVAQQVDSDFWLIGSGFYVSQSEKESLQTLVKEHYLEGRFRHLARVNHIEMPAMYAAVAKSGGCLLSTSWAESFGLAVLEAMAAGCPVIVPDVIGLRDVVTNGETGLLYPALNIERASTLVVELITNDRRRLALATSAQQRARSYTLARSVDELLAAFEFLITEGSRQQSRLRSEGQVRTAIEHLLEQFDQLKQQLERANQQITELNAKLARDEHFRADEFEQKIDELETALAAEERLARELESTVLEKNLSLARINESQYWKILTAYWRTKSRVRRAAHRFSSWGPVKRFARDTRDTNDRSSTSTVTDWATSAAEVANPLIIELRSRAAAPIVFCFPIIDWHFRYQRPQQLATQFARDGKTVVYIRTSFHQDGSNPIISRLAENIFELHLPGPYLNLYKHEIKGDVLEELMDVFDKFRRSAQIVEAISLVQLPFWTPLAQAARARHGWKIVYDCMDDHAGFSTNRPAMLKYEKELLSSCDLVVSSSKYLHDKNRVVAKRALLLPNATDFEHFHRNSLGAETGMTTAVERRRLADIQHPIIGYYGAISDWFDTELIRGVAIRRPDWSFVLIGSTYGADVTKLEALDNVHLLGELPYESLPGYLHDFDVACIPFILGSLTLATSPVKFYEYLSAGKPVVGVDLPELAEFRESYYVANGVEEFITGVERALSDTGEEAINRRLAIAKSNTWRARYETLWSKILELYGKVSIVVLSHNNPEYLRLCLESIWKNTEYPRYEVVVVDNASFSGVVEYLKECEASEPRLRVVYSDRNIGFAPGINLGIASTKGSDYLVLLNDDTVVTRGWLSRLIRHLGDPRIGLIGPVTNQTTNAAKVDVSYEDLHGLASFAAAWTFAHEGRGFKIPMLAMHCVAMRHDVFTFVGPLDERYEIGLFEDEDYSMRVRQTGYEVVCAEDVFVHHWGGASLNRMGTRERARLSEANRRKYEEKWQLKWKQPGLRSGHEEEFNLDVWKDPQNPSTPQVSASEDSDLQSMIIRARDSRGTVIFLPSIGWDVTLVQRPHHLAKAFAELGYLTIFDCSNSPEEITGFKELEKNLFLFRGDDRLLRQLPQPILWSFPYNFELKDNYSGSAKVIYDWIDDMDVFPHDRGFLDRNRDRALKEAAVFASVARRLHQEAAALRPDAIYLPNAVDEKHFEAWAEYPTNDADVADLVESQSPLAGYYGALASWFDYELLNRVAALLPDWNFLLIGPDYDGSIKNDGSDLLARPNVRWIGPRPYEVLPSYLKRFDVAMIPFAINHITLATSPLKLYEYFAGGKSVVTTPLPECEAHSDVWIGHDATEFSMKLVQALAMGADPAYQERARTCARANSWNARVTTVIHQLDALRGSNNNAL